MNEQQCGNILVHCNYNTLAHIPGITCGGLIRNANRKIITKKQVFQCNLLQRNDKLHKDRFQNDTLGYTGYTQKNGAVSKVNKKFISHLTRAQRTPSAAETVQVSHALPAVRFSCLMRGRGASFQDGVAAGKGFLCAPF